MHKNISVILDQPLDQFVSQQEADFRRLKENEIRQQALKQAIKEGEDSGVASYSLENLITELDHENTF